MLTISQPYTILLLCSVVIPACLSISAIKHRPNLGARSFSILMAVVALWALVALFEVSSQDPLTKIFSYGLKYLFIVITPPAWLVFSLCYANRLRKLHPVFLAAISILPLLTLILVSTNGYHHWMFTSFEMVHTGNYFLLYPNFGPWFWVHTGYSYIILSAGFLLLTKHLLNSPAHFKRQIVSLMIAGGAPWISNIIFIFKINVLLYFDLTPIAFSISGIAFMWGILRYQLLDVVPIARDNVIQNMDDGVIIVDTKQRILDINPAACQLVKQNPPKLIGAKAHQVFAWWPKFGLDDNRQHSTTKPIIELRVNGKCRLICPVRTRLQSKDKSIGHLLTLRDVTGQLRAEEALRNSEERFKSLSENAPIIIFTLDKKGFVTYVNRAWETILGRECQNSIGRPFQEIIIPNAKQAHKSIFDQLLKGQKSVAEVKFHARHRDGSRRLFNATATANSDAEGRIIGIIGLAKDVTKAHRLQEQLFQTQKMKAVGTLAGGIAHDFNNLLMGIQANVSLIRSEIATSETALFEKLNRIENQIQSGAALTRQLLGYARKGKSFVDSISLDKLIKETLHVVERTNKNISVACDLKSKSSFIQADKGQIELVLLNLFINAVDAMPDGGRLKVSSRLVPSTEFAQRWSLAKNGLYIELTISDTGIGMDEDTKTRIFEPFFTTKDVGQGSGLGLASVYGIIENHGGQIEVESQPDQGATFTILLPATEKKILEMTPRPPSTLPAGIGKILLVDDEALY
jgi:PAS domain S-box-containing protein